MRPRSRPQERQSVPAVIRSEGNHALVVLVAALGGFTGGLDRGRPLLPGAGSLPDGRSSFFGFGFFTAAALMTKSITGLLPLLVLFVL